MWKDYDSGSCKDLCGKIVILDHARIVWKDYDSGSCKASL